MQLLELFLIVLHLSTDRCDSPLSFADITKPAKTTILYTDWPFNGKCYQTSTVSRYPIQSPDLHGHTVPVFHLFLFTADLSMCTISNSLVTLMLITWSPQFHELEYPATEHASSDNSQVCPCALTLWCLSYSVLLVVWFHSHLGPSHSSHHGLYWVSRFRGH